jgi:membrane-bound lytic murein transglycosylase A
MLAGCASVPLPPADEVAPGAPAPLPGIADQAPLPPPVVQGRSRWQPVRWSELPGFGDDTLHEAWNAWLKSCERPGAVFAPLCPEVRQLSIGSAQEQRSWMMRRLQPYRVEPLQGAAEGLLTAYYEPMLEASRQRTATHTVPLYRPPANLAGRKPWYSRQDIDTLPEARAALRGRVEGKVLKPYDDAGTIASKGAKAPVLAWLTDPMDLQLLQIQGSGRVRLGDGTQIRLAYAEQNGHPYRAIGRWLVDQGQLKKEDVTMDAIRSWARASPARVPELLRSNPSYVFFVRNPDSPEGPRGSLNVPLTAGYSVAVDRTVVPLGSLLWLSTTRPDGSPVVRPVAAQDTGGAIAGEVRADLYWGSGDAAGKLAGDMKQKGNIWMLWPKGVPLPN